MVVYSCTHELPDTDAYVERAKVRPFNYRPTNVLTRIKRALSQTTTIRRPCMDLCPACQAEQRMLRRRGVIGVKPELPRSQTLPVQVSQPMVETPAPGSSVATGSQPPTALTHQPWNLAEGPPDLPNVGSLGQGWDSDRLTVFQGVPTAQGRPQMPMLAHIGRSNTVGPSLSQAPQLPPPPSPNPTALQKRVHSYKTEMAEKAIKEHNDRLSQSPEMRPLTPLSLGEPALSIFASPDSEYDEGEEEEDSSITRKSSEMDVISTRGAEERGGD